MGRHSRRHSEVGGTLSSLLHIGDIFDKISSQEKLKMEQENRKKNIERRKSGHPKKIKIMWAAKIPTHVSDVETT